MLPGWANFSGLINRTITGFGFKLTPEEKVQEQEIDGYTFKCAPGLKILDEDGLKVARQSGWIILSCQWRDYDNENYR